MFKDYVELTKPRLTALVMLSALVGFVLAARNPFPWTLLMLTWIGTAFVAAGSMTLNQWMESKWDALMDRTKNRPIPAGSVKSSTSFVIGIFFSFLGLGLLYFKVNTYAMLVALMTTLSYLVLYTPMKRVTSLCTIVGAIPGALPPLIGWAAITGPLPYEAWIIFAVIFFWQMPHFLAIAWIYRKDFKKGGFCMLTLEDETGDRVARQIVLYQAALIPVSLLPTLFHVAGVYYFFGALMMGIYFIYLGFKSLKNLEEMARPIFKASLIYLTVIFLLLMVDKVR